MLGKSKSKVRSPTKTHDVDTTSALQPGYEKAQFQRAAFDPARWSQRKRQKSIWRKFERLLKRELKH
jgi:hypothetical protein